MTVLAVFGSFISYIYSGKAGRRAGGHSGRRAGGQAGRGAGNTRAAPSQADRLNCALTDPNKPLVLIGTGAGSTLRCAAAPPLKLKQSGWAGNYALGSSYIALPWWAGQVRHRDWWLIP